MYKSLLLCSSIFMATGCNLLKKPVYCQDCTPTSPDYVMPKPQDVVSPNLPQSGNSSNSNSQVTAPQNTNQMQIGTLDRSRNGFFAFGSGDGFSKARTSLAAAFPATRISDFSQISSSNLQGKKLLILNVLFTDTTPMQALNEFEQQALFQFVRGGGSVLLLTDHSDFASANASLLNVFGTTATGVIRRQNIVQVLPQDDLLNGRAGAVREVTQHWAGSYNKVPTEALKVVKNSGGDSVVYLRKNAIASGSGKVIMVSDASMFVDDEDTGYFSRNQTLFLNCLNALLD